MSNFEWIMISGNVCTLCFFFGFHFGQFKILRADVHAIRLSVEKIEEQTNRNSFDIGILKDRAS